MSNSNEGLNDAEQGLQLLELSAVRGLSNLLLTWYEEAGLQGVLRSLDATLSQCYAIIDTIETGDGADPLVTRRVLSEHILFMHNICNAVPISSGPCLATGEVAVAEGGIPG